MLNIRAIGIIFFCELSIDLKYFISVNYTFTLHEISKVL